MRKHVFSCEFVHPFDENGSAPITLSGYGIPSRLKPKKLESTLDLQRVHCAQETPIVCDDTRPDSLIYNTYISRSPIDTKEDGNYDEWRVVEVVVDCATNRKSFESYSKQI